MKYAISGATKISKHMRYDVVIVGAGIAGLYTALNIDDKFKCLIIAKDSIDLSNSWLAQGGIAAAVGDDDAPVFHLEDTLIAGAGLCDRDAVTILVDEGPSDIERLVKLNVPFDIDDAGELQITREGGHRKDRVVHAGGDATGRETVKALAQIVSRRGNITFSGNTCLFDILTDDNGVYAVVVRYNNEEFHLLETNNVVIATGGIGQVYKASTNPSVATGDGLAAALRAGVVLMNLEFIQFHPTGLWQANSDGREFLISEAVRGEGGLLKNKDGVRFMKDEHELCELAPRDIVARSIIRELRRSGQECAYIDITSKDEEQLKKRFPTIFDECLRRGINISKDLIPVYPVQHYLMGGIETDLHARTQVKGLYACGEAASTGVHGANRLASNSMLECLVFGRRAAEDINRLPHDKANKAIIKELQNRPRARLDYSAKRKQIQELMNDYCHVVRRKTGLKYALGKVEEIYTEIETVYDDCNEYLELLNIATVAKAILEAAIKRPESIGSHYIEQDD